MTNDIAPSTGNGQLKALQWTATLLSLSIVLTALMIGQGIFGGTSSLITDHGYFGNVIFILGIIQVGLALFCWQKNAISRNLVILSGLILIALVAQIGLGYMGHRSGIKEATVVHFGLGVLSMGLITANATLFWLAPAREPHTT